MKIRMWSQVLVLVIAVAVLLGGSAQADPKKSDPKKEVIPKELLGRWDHYKTDTVYIRFAKDGTFRWVTLAEEIVGVCRTLDGGVIEFTAIRRGEAPKAKEFKYRVKDEVLELKIGEEWHKYSKSK